MEDEVKNVLVYIKKIVGEIFEMSTFSFSGNEDGNLWENTQAFLMFEGTELNEPDFHKSIYHFVINKQIGQIENLEL